MDAFIDDGYQKTVGFNAVDGLHPAMEFTYRPFAGNDGSRAYRKILSLSQREPAKSEERLLKTLADRVGAWNLDKPVSKANFKRLVGPLFEKLHYVVFGQMPPDYELLADGEKRIFGDADDEFDADEDDVKN